MTGADKSALMAALNFLLCSGIIVICICRSVHMSGSSTRLVIRLAYMLTAVGATISGLWFYFTAEYPGWDSIVMAIALFWHIASGRRAWRFGLPDFAKSDRAPLNEEATR